MAASNEPGVWRVYKENAVGDKTILLESIRSEQFSSTTLAERSRLDVAGSRVAQMLAPSPTTGRAITGIPLHVIPENGYLVLALKSDAADTLDSDDALAKYNIQVVVRDLTQVGTPLEYRVKTLTKGDRDTDRVPDDPTVSTTGFTDVIAWKVQTGQQLMVHGEAELWAADDTA